MVTLDKNPIVPVPLVVDRVVPVFNVVEPVKVFVVMGSRVTILVCFVPYNIIVCTT